MKGKHKATDQKPSIEQEEQGRSREEDNPNMESRPSNSFIPDPNQSMNQSMFVKNRPYKCKPTRPRIDADIGDLEWQIFEDAWCRYKRLAELEIEDEICLELRECCSSDVNKRLYEFNGKDTLNDPRLKEKKLLDLVRNVAVKSIHKEIHRKHFNEKSQETGESVTKFVGRLKAQAALCNFTVQCECQRLVSYAESMVAQRLITGLENAEHQSKVLSEAQALPDLKSKVERLVSLETSEDATSEIRSTPTETMKVAAGRFSQYKKSKRFQSPEIKKKTSQFQRKGEQNRRKLRCRGCGLSSHGEGKSMNREDCQAFGKECLVCHKKNHFAKVCDKRNMKAN